MAKLVRVSEDWAPEGYLFKCPGCGNDHIAIIKRRADNPNGPEWTFDGNMGKPTFNPSFLTKYTRRITDDEHARIMAGEKLNIPQSVCHIFVRNGQIQYLSDCTHGYAGKTIDMVDMEE